MKKNGFSLAELLISLSIIAVAAALIIPAIDKVTPDKYKARVLKNYIAVNNATEELLNNNNIYYRRQPDANITANDIEADGTFKASTQYGCIGLSCTTRPTLSVYNSSDYEGICKYPNLMADMLQLKDITKCSASGTTDRVAKGTAADQTYWEIKSKGSSAGDGYTIMIDLDPASDSVNCSYKNGGNDECKYPDRFIFNVDNNGDITASSDDNMTRVYLENMTRTDKKADFDEAAQ